MQVLMALAPGHVIASNHILGKALPWRFPKLRYNPFSVLRLHGISHLKDATSVHWADLHGAMEIQCVAFNWKSSKWCKHILKWQTAFLYVTDICTYVIINRRSLLVFIHWLEVNIRNKTCMAWSLDHVCIIYFPRIWDKGQLTVRRINEEVLL